MRILRRLLLLVVVLGILSGVYQWHIYQNKLSIREDALLYFHEEDYAKTIGYLEDALDKPSIFSKSLDMDMTCYMAESYYQLGEYDKAIAIYDGLIEDYPKNASLYVLKGACFQGGSRYKKAIRIYKEGYKNTSDPLFLSRICEIYVEKGDYEAALEYAKKGAAEGKDQVADFLYEEIVIYEKSQDYEAAYQAACRYCDAYPDDERGQREKTFLASRI